MTTDYLSLKEAVEELDESMEVLCQKNHGKWGPPAPEEYDRSFTHSRPDCMFEFGDKGNLIGPTFCATVEVIWDFIEFSKSIWVSPAGGGFDQLKEKKAKRRPQKSRSLENGHFNLVLGTVTDATTIVGKGEELRTCSAGEAVFVSRAEFEAFRAHLNDWFTEAVCVVDESYHGRKNYIPTYLEYHSAQTDPAHPSLVGDEADAAFFEFLNDPSNQPITGTKRDDWSKSNLASVNGLSRRDVGREIWKRLKPEGGSKPGRKPIPAKKF